MRQSGWSACIALGTYSDCPRFLSLRSNGHITSQAAAFRAFVLVQASLHDIVRALTSELTLAQCTECLGRLHSALRRPLRSGRR